MHMKEWGKSRTSHLVQLGANFISNSHAKRWPRQQTSFWTVDGAGDNDADDDEYVLRTHGKVVLYRGANLTNSFLCCFYRSFLLDKKHLQLSDRY